MIPLIRPALRYFAEINMEIQKWFNLIKGRDAEIQNIGFQV